MCFISEKEEVVSVWPFPVIHFSRWWQFSTSLWASSLCLKWEVKGAELLIQVPALGELREQWGMRMWRLPVAHPTKLQWHCLQQEQGSHCNCRNGLQPLSPGPHTEIEDGAFEDAEREAWPERRWVVEKVAEGLKWGMGFLATDHS